MPIRMSQETGGASYYASPRDSSLACISGLFACLSFRPQRCGTGFCERQLRLPWGAATFGGDIPMFCSGVVRTGWDSHGLEAQFVDRGFYLCCQVTLTGRHVFSHDGLFDDSQPESRVRSQGVRFDHHSDRCLWTPRLPSGHRKAGITGGSFWQYAGLTSTGLRFGVRSRNVPCGRQGGWDSVSCAPSHLIL
jgi:hypothetical protein